MGGQHQGFDAGPQQPARHSDRVRAILAGDSHPATAPSSTATALLEPPVVPATPVPTAPALVEADSNPAAGTRRARGRRPATLVLALAVVAAGAGTYAAFGTHKTSATPPATPAQPAATWATRWDPSVLPVARFVEKDRGLSFEHPVAVHFLSEAAFDRLVSVPQPTAKSSRQAMDQALQALRAVGLVQGNVNLATSENELQQSSVVGVYEPDHKAVYVRGTDMTPFVRVTLAHELDHALQDQYFGLNRLERAVPGDDSALQALIEGDATRVENDYEQTLSSDDQALYSRESSAAGAAAQTAGNPAQVPQVLQDMSGFAEALGPSFVDSLIADGGLAALNAAYRHPPQASAQMLDPVQYPIGWKPAAVPAPAIPAGDHTLDHASPFGQLMLFEVLGSRLGYDQAWAAVQGWQGDNSVPYTDAGRTCVAVDVRMADASHTASLAGAGASWSKSVPGATVSASGTLVSFRSCDPGAAAASAPLFTPPAFEILAARAALVDMVMTANHVDFPMGRCVADNVIAALGPTGEGQLLADTLTPAQQQAMFKLAMTAAQQCKGSGVA